MTTTTIVCYIYSVVRLGKGGAIYFIYNNMRCVVVFFFVCVEILVIPLNVMNELLIVRHIYIYILLFLFEFIQCNGGTRVLWL